MNTLPLVGAAFGLGLFVALAGIAGSHRTPRASPSRGREPRKSVVLPAAVAIATGVVLFVLTGWLVGACLGGLAAAVVPRAMSDASRPRESVRRSEAVATWAEMLRDTMAAAAGIEEAIISTAPIAPLAIRSEVRRLAARLERAPLSACLRGFAEEMGDPTADLVVSALLLATEHRARDLGALLGALSASARIEAAMVLRVEAGRSRLRTAARVVTVTTLGFALLLILFNREFLAPYDDALGQAWLLVVGSLFALGVRELGRLARVVAPPRLLALRADAAADGHAA